MCYNGLFFIFDIVSSILSMIGSLVAVTLFIVSSSLLLLIDDCYHFSVIRFFKIPYLVPVIGPILKDKSQVRKSHKYSNRASKEAE